MAFTAFVRRPRALPSNKKNQSTYIYLFIKKYTQCANEITVSLIASL
jgi:hypothetical protein